MSITLAHVRRRGKLLAVATAVSGLFMIALWVGLITPPDSGVEFKVAPDGTAQITRVAPFSLAWRLGVRPEMTIDQINDADAKLLNPRDPSVYTRWSLLWVQLSPSSDQLIGIPRTVNGSVPSISFLLGGTLLPLLWLGALVGSRLTWGFAVGILFLAVSPLVPSMEPPLSTAFWIAPILTGRLGLQDPVVPGRWRLVADLMLAAFLLSGILFLQGYGPSPSVLVNLGPLGGGLIVLLLGVCVAGSAFGVVRARRLQERLSWPATIQALADEVVPGRTQTRLHAAEIERRRLAAELHREVLPTLYAAIAQLNAGDETDQVQAALLRGLEDELRLLMTDRHPVMLELEGAMVALAWLVEQVEEQSGVPIEMQVADGGEGRPPAHVEQALYRIAQLALDNALRHASPGQLTLRLRAEAEGAELRLADDGPGMRPGAEMTALQRGSLGLADMRAYARSTGGSLDLEAVTPHGTEVVYRWQR